MEDRWDDGLCIDLEVHAGLLSKSQELFQHEPGRFFEDRVDTRVNESGVALSILFSNQDLVLNMEVRDVELQIHILRDDKATDDIILDLGHESIIGGSWVDSTVIKHIFHGARLSKGTDEFS